MTRRIPRRLIWLFRLYAWLHGVHDPYARAPRLFKAMKRHRRYPDYPGYTHEQFAQAYQNNALANSASNYTASALQNAAYHNMLSSQNASTQSDLTNLFGFRV